MSRCKHCDHELIWRSHKKITPKILRQAYYFSKWEYCTNCRTVWFHEEFKVHNRNDAGRYARNSAELAGQSSFLSSL